MPSLTVTSSNQCGSVGGGATSVGREQPMKPSAISIPRLNPSSLDMPAYYPIECAAQLVAEYRGDVRRLCYELSYDVAKTCVERPRRSTFHNTAAAGVF